MHVQVGLIRWIIVILSLYGDIFASISALKSVYGASQCRARRKELFMQWRAYFERILPRNSGTMVNPGTVLLLIMYLKFIQ